MKKMIIILFLLCASTSSFAFDVDPRIGAIAGMAVVDYGQTVDIVIEPIPKLANGTTWEFNPLLGKHPTKQKLVYFGVGSIATMLLLDEVIPDGAFKNILFDSIVTSERYNVEWNERMLGGHSRTVGIPILVTFRW